MQNVGYYPYVHSLLIRKLMRNATPYLGESWAGNFRDGPLENLWEVAGEVQKKYSRKEKLNEKKFMHAN